MYSDDMLGVPIYLCSIVTRLLFSLEKLVITFWPPGGTSLCISNCSHQGVATSTLLLWYVLLEALSQAYGVAALYVE